MILIWAVVAGLLAGVIRARVGKHKYQIPEIHLLWLVPVAFLPQALAFQWPLTEKLFSDNQAAIALVGSQILLLVFAWANRKIPAFWYLGLGLVLNLLVISLNGGFMPISPETVSRLSPITSSWRENQRLWGGKDIVLTTDATIFWWLSDRLLFPDWFPWQAAFSIGDILIAIGAFWLLWMSGKNPQENHQTQR